MDRKDLDTLFLEARSHKFFQDRPVNVSLLEKIYSLARMAPTAWNTCPMRIAFVKSPEAKEKLLTALSPGNVNKTKSAPVTAIMAIDKDFPNKLNLLAPAMAGDPIFSKMSEKGYLQFVYRNANLQAGFFILAARLCGLDCGPMSGFNNDQVDNLFFEGTSWKSNFLINLGYGSGESLPLRAPRLHFEDACKIL